MTTVSPQNSAAAHRTRFVQLSADEFRGLLPTALDIYVEAMRYPVGTASQRTPMWLGHILRAGWRCIAALDEQGVLIGFAYGYQGTRGQWWREQVHRGLVNQHGPDIAESQLADYFELTEIHVRPQHQGSGIGEELLRRLLYGLPHRQVLLSTPEGTSRAWRLYRRLGFRDVLRHHYFAGDPRPFAILGRELPLEPRGSESRR